MLKAGKVRLKPTPEQEILFWKSAGVARWSYNYYLSENEKYYRENHESLKEGECRKYINNVLKKTTHPWLKEVGSNVMKQAVKDAALAWKRHFQGLAEKPRYKSRHRSKISFYVNYESLVRKPGGFHGEKIGFVKTAEALPEIAEGKKYSNPRISYDGKYWYLSVGYEVPEQRTELTGESIGIDLGIKELAYCSNGKKYKNINKTQRVKKLEKRLKREQRKLSRMLTANIKGHKMEGKKRYPVWIRPLKECRNIQKQNRVIRRIHRRLTDIRTNHIHQITAEIVKAKPSRIVMEALKVTGMMKNRHLSRAVAQQKFYEFKRQIRYKSVLHGIAFAEADCWYPSSKKCSCCGSIKTDLKLSDRTYRCKKCGLIIDRDLNASINLANYRSV